MQSKFIKTIFLPGFIWLAVALLTQSAFGAGPDTVVYAVTSGSGIIETLDLNTGVFTQLAAPGLPLSAVTGLAEFGGVLYGASSILFQINPSNGALTVAPLPFSNSGNSFGPLNGIGSTTAGVFAIGAGNGNNALYSVNTTTGNVTLIGLTGVFAGGGTGVLSTSTDSSKLYWETQAGFTDTLYSIDTSTGAATLIGAVTVGFPSPTGNPTALTFIGGTLWANFYTYGFGTINTSTGAQTLVSTNTTPTYVGFAPFPLGGGPITSALPQLAYGGGWYTALYFSNTTNSPVSVPVSFLSDTGAPLSVPLLGIGSVTSQTLNVGPGSTVVLEAPNTGNLVQGWVEATLPQGVVGYAIFRQSVNDGRPDQEAVVPLTPESSQSAGFSYDDVNFTTTMSFLNPSNQQATVTITAYKGDGSQIGSTQVGLVPRAKQVKSLRDLFPGVVGQRGRVSLAVSSGDVSVLGFRFGAIAFTTIPVTHASQMPTSTTTFAVPQVPFGGGWYTALYFSNISASPKSVPVNFTSDTGTPLSVPLLGIGSVTSQTVNLTAGATAVLEAPNTGNLVQGWAEATLPPGVIGYAIFRQSVSDGRPDQEAVVPLTLEANQAADFSFDDTNVTTTMGFLNPSNTEATAHITVYGADGSQIGTTQVQLPGRSKLVRVLKDLFPAVVGKLGRVSLYVNNGAISVLGFRFGPVAFTTIPVTSR